MVGPILHKWFRFTAALIFSRLLYHTDSLLLWLLWLYFALEILIYCLITDFTFYCLFRSNIPLLDMFLTTIHCSYVKSIGIYVLTFLAFLVFLFLYLLVVFLFAIYEELFIVCSIIVVLFLWFLTRIKKIKI